MTICRAVSGHANGDIPISQGPVRGDTRFAELKRWLDGIDAVTGAEITPASEDASFRRYFRCRLDSSSYIVMDAPPPQEDCRPFVAVAAYLEAMGLNAPRVLEADVEHGFLLLTDLGERQYLSQLRENPDSSGRLYDDALQALSTMQRRGRAYQAELPPYDVALLEYELALFHDWLCGTHLGIAFDARTEKKWRELCSKLIGNALAQPRVFVHRDYHSRNLMVVDENNPGILDFQDAVEGPLTYDLVSLLKDCYLRLPAEEVRQRAVDFYASTPADIQKRIAAEEFLERFELTGVQRHLKAAGIFARLNHRDGKAQFLDDIPRTLAYVTELADRHDALVWVVELIEARILPAFAGVE